MAFGGRSFERRDVLRLAAVIAVVAVAGLAGAGRGSPDC